MTATLDATRSADHSPNGQFARGNRGGPGNPFGRRVAEFRGTIIDRLTHEKFVAIVDAMIERAIDGDLAAGRLILQYALGKPGRVVDPDQVEFGGFDAPPAAPIPEPMPATPTSPRPVGNAPAAAPSAPSSKAARKAMRRAMRNLGKSPSPNGANGLGGLDPFSAIETGATGPLSTSLIG